ncbi:MAG: moeA [Ignavibacteria bacterium]|nr:moeA [Ignavibacteria bacterium]
MTKYREALSLIVEELKKLSNETERVGILHSVGRVLSLDIISDIYLPPFNTSEKDGICISYNPQITEWDLVGEITAGNYSDITISSNQTISVMTGAKIPESADTVIPFEDLNVIEDEVYLKEGAKVKSGQNLILRGSIIKQNEKAINKNTFIKNQDIALAAACGADMIEVFCKRKIAILSTGDELVDIYKTPANAQIRLTNNSTVLSLIKSIGANGINLGIVRDNPELIRKSLEDAFDSEADIVIISGGTSNGKHDFVKKVFYEMGVEIKFNCVKIKPGAPTIFGTYLTKSGTKLLFGFPGNPISTFLCFLIFIREAFSMAQLCQPPSRIDAVLKNKIRKKGNNRTFLLGRIIYNRKIKQYCVFPTHTWFSQNIDALSKSNCIIEISAGKMNLKKGDTVNCIHF